MSEELVRTQTAQSGLQLSDEPRSMLAVVMEAVRDPSMDPARLREFLEIGKELEAREAKKQYVSAFMAAKKDLDCIKIRKDGKIVYEDKPGKRGGTIKFMRYDDIADVVRPVLAAHDLAATFGYEFIATPPRTVCVMTVSHRAGHAEQFRSVPLPLSDSGGGKNEVQGAGSVSSYGRRYVICPAFDIVAEGEDDDGSGSGVPEKITDAQAMAIEDTIQEIENRQPGARVKITNWLQKEFQIDSPAKLMQGAQLAAFNKQLAAKAKALGI